MNIVDLAKGKHAISTLTGRMRWRGGILEQETAYQDYEDGRPVGGYTGWSPVPTVDVEAGGTSD